MYRQAQFYHPIIKFYKNREYFWLAFVSFCWLPPLFKIFIWANLLVKVALAMLYKGKKS